MLPMNLKTLPERFVWARKNKGLSQVSLAEILNVSQQSIEKLENGHVTKPKYLPEAAKALGVPYGWLLKNEAKQDDWEQKALEELRQLDEQGRTAFENLIKAWPKKS